MPKAHPRKYIHSSPDSEESESSGFLTRFTPSDCSTTEVTEYQPSASISLTSSDSDGSFLREAPPLSSSLLFSPNQSLELSKKFTPNPLRAKCLPIQSSPDSQESQSSNFLTPLSPATAVPTTLSKAVAISSPDSQESESSGWLTMSDLTSANCSKVASSKRKRKVTRKPFSRKKQSILSSNSSLNDDSDDDFKEPWKSYNMTQENYISQKQPVKSILKKTTRQSNCQAAIPKKSPLKSKRKRRPGMKAICEIQAYQKSTNLLIPRLPFDRLVKEIAQDISVKGGDLRFQAAAIDALQEVTEDYIVKLFQYSALCANHAGRENIIPKDLNFARSIREETIEELLYSLKEKQIQAVSGKSK